MPCQILISGPFVQWYFDMKGIHWAHAKALVSFHVIIIHVVQKHTYIPTKKQQQKTLDHKRLGTE